MEKQHIPFTMIANEVLCRPGISLKAKGLYAYLFSKPDDWQFSSKRMVKEMQESYPTILVVLRELEDAKLLERKKLKSGRVDYFLSYSEPIVSQGQDSLPWAGSKNATLANLHSGNSLPISNTEENTNTDINTKRETPAQFARNFFEHGQAFQEVEKIFSGRISHEVFLREATKFVMYWTELNKSGTRQRWELERTFDVKRRLYTWLSRSREFSAAGKYAAANI